MPPIAYSFLTFAAERILTGIANNICGLKNEADHFACLISSTDRQLERIYRFGLTFRTLVKISYSDKSMK